MYQLPNSREKKPCSEIGLSNGGHNINIAQSFKNISFKFVSTGCIYHRVSVE